MTWNPGSLEVEIAIRTVGYRGLGYGGVVELQSMVAGVLDDGDLVILVLLEDGVSPTSVSELSRKDRTHILHLRRF